MVEEGLVDKKAAVSELVEPGHLDQLLHPRFENEAGYADKVIARGLPASPGAAFGRIALSAIKAEKMAIKGEVILVRSETNPEDIGGINASSGVLFFICCHTSSDKNGMNG